MLSIIGKLQFYYNVVKDGTTFIRRLIELSKKPKLLYHKVKISKQTWADLAWWDICLESHNGIYSFPKPLSIDTTRIIFTDSSDVAVSIVCGDAWLVFKFTGKYLWMTKKPIVRKTCLLLFYTYIWHYPSESKCYNVFGQYVYGRVNKYRQD